MTDYAQKYKKEGLLYRVCLEWYMLQTVEDITNSLKADIRNMEMKHKEVLKLVSKEKAHADLLIEELKEQQKKTVKLTAISMTASIVAIFTIILHIVLTLR